jgi:hypothetical protein
MWKQFTWLVNPSLFPEDNNNGDNNGDNNTNTNKR